jgi:hypothetical protein
MGSSPHGDPARGSARSSPHQGDATDDHQGTSKWHGRRSHRDDVGGDVGRRFRANVSAQTKIKSGFNLFSTDQDLEIGRRSAAEVERQLPILGDRSVEAYVDAIGKRLAAVIPGADFPYQFKIVNASTSTPSLRAATCI